MIRQRDQIEHQGDVLLESGGCSGGCFRDGHVREVVRFHLLHAALDLPDGIEIIAEHGLVLRAEAALEVGGFGRYQVEHAGILMRQSLALLRGVALAEEALEQLARLGLHGQRSVGCAERNRARVATAEIAVARATSAAPLNGAFDGRQRPVSPISAPFWIIYAACSVRPTCTWFAGWDRLPAPLNRR